MKCPVCDYEYNKGIKEVLKKEKLYSRGPKKGEIKEIIDIPVMYDIGDERFKRLVLKTAVEDRTNTDYWEDGVIDYEVILNVCPKCKSVTIG